MLDFSGPCHFLSLRNVLIRRVRCLESETGIEGKQPHDRDRDWSDALQAKKMSRIPGNRQKLGRDKDRVFPFAYRRNRTF